MRTSTVADTVAVELEARTAAYDANMARSAANFDRAMDSVVRSAGRAQIALGGLIAGGAILAGFAALRLATSDAVADFQRLENRLKVSGLEGEKLRQTLLALAEISIRNGQNIDSLANLYQRLSIAQKSLGTNSQEMIVFTERIAQALRLQGTSATQARGALLQLTQAVGSGIVRAEEFNSISEGALPILQAVARGLREAGGDVATLRTLVVDGKVSSEAFFRAFLKGSEDLEERLTTQTRTVQQAHEGLSTAFTIFIGDLDRATGASEAYVGVLGRITNALQDLNKGTQDAGKELGIFEQFYRNLFRAPPLRQPGDPLWPGNRIPPSERPRPAVDPDRMVRPPPQQTLVQDNVSIDDFPVKNAKKKRTDADREADWWENQAEQYEKAIDAQERANRKLAEEITLLGQTQYERDKQLMGLKLREEAQRRGIELTDAELTKIDALAYKYAALNEQLRIEKQRRQDVQALQQAFGELSISSIEGLVDGSKKLNDVLADTLKLLARMALQAAILGQGPLAGIFGTRGATINNGGGQNVGGLIGGIFGGFFANGGSTPGNRPIVTGENGPEMWLPGRAGSVVKNSDLVSSAQAQGSPVIMNNDFRDSSAPAIAAINARINRLERSLPNIIKQTQTIGRQNEPFYGS